VWHYPDGKGATNGTIRVQFDRFLSTETPNRQSFCVSNTTNPDNCLTAGTGSGAVTLSVEYDPVDRVVVLKPSKPLTPGKFRVRVLAPKNADDTGGIRAFDGVAMAKEFSWEFDVDSSALAQEPNRKVDFCNSEHACTPPDDAGTPQKPVPIQTSIKDVVQNCASEGSCHMPPDDPEKPPKTLVGEPLILEVPEDGGPGAQIKRIIAQHQVAPQTATDPDPGQPRTTGQDTFGRNMPFIDPHNPGNSYILYKMIIGMLTCPGGGGADPSYCSGDGGTYGGNAVFSTMFYGTDAGACTDTVIHQPGDLVPFPAWVPVDSWHPPADGEYDRLRYHIRGLQMPQGSYAPPHDIHVLSAWIAGGAPVTNCPVVAP
jgi:hypothetical protein